MEVKCNNVRVKARIRADQPSQSTVANTGDMSSEETQQSSQSEYYSNTVSWSELQDLLHQLESDLKRHIEFRFARQGKEKRP
ncbi:hypothetical protein [Pseudoalteromonas luteoviolacea]|uniref:Uncharacterized protein n=1 Tax=Pseudoalteromonas luteoviolacea S4054 TaxID=1129367 RepID=A0A0F6ACE0_9GAMM|nr:hypothetical protein [Pseudoalteromonas luteoviolacea]AOT08508.1 hypothetical protein S4054249_11910 [Pseudoalteromonas luteoviolacea]AOT13424.1 hypothetical protein S40542_11885 [Pseudoalteromonas luteoviolacea]AOT18337.1 hypothetical protein S4054_11885 [Pseudoalteromonas luteoviolacea]KKE83496.1 hypothetical protein N479_14080 [Pseudoalteromonas luteoviolacea S4054]KZN75933.1 hypothetical protein N481_06175 [Pseudoalteromonas luteoviolacea S4047-1]